MSRRCDHILGRLGAREILASNRIYYCDVGLIVWRKYCPECGALTFKARKRLVDDAWAAFGPKMCESMISRSPWLGLVKRGKFPGGLSETRKSI